MNDWYVELDTLSKEQMLELEEAAERVTGCKLKFHGFEDMIGWRQPCTSSSPQLDYWGYNTLDFGGSKRVGYEEALSLLESTEVY